MNPTQLLFLLSDTSGVQPRGGSTEEALMAKCSQAISEEFPVPTEDLPKILNYPAGSIKSLTRLHPSFLRDSKSVIGTNSVDQDFDFAVRKRKLLAKAERALSLLVRTRDFSASIVSIESRLARGKKDDVPLKIYKGLPATPAHYLLEVDYI